MPENPYQAPQSSDPVAPSREIEPAAALDLPDAETVNQKTARSVLMMAGWLTYIPFFPLLWHLEFLLNRDLVSFPIWTMLKLAGATSVAAGVHLPYCCASIRGIGLREAF